MGAPASPIFCWRACSSIKTTADAQHSGNATGVSFFGNGEAGVLLPSCRRPETESAPGLFHCRQQSPGNSAIIRPPPVESHCKSVTYNDWCSQEDSKSASNVHHRCIGPAAIFFNGETRPEILGNSEEITASLRHLELRLAAQTPGKGGGICPEQGNYLLYINCLDWLVRDAVCSEPVSTLFSLLRANLQGISAISRPSRRSLHKIITLLQRDMTKFPKKRNRELIRDNREETDR